MTEEKKQILEFIRIYLEANPSIRFGQALFNLKINEFNVDEIVPGEEFILRDIYNDSDEKILNRIWVGDNHEFKLDIE